MRILYAFAFLSFFFGTHSVLAQSNEVLGEVQEYDAERLTRISNALGILDAIDSNIEDYDIVLYSELAEDRYQITFTTAVIFAEDGLIRGPDIKMIFSSVSEKLVGLIVLE